MSQQTIDRYISLFRGRGDAYGSWEGGCVRKPLDAHTFERHLKGEELIGVYPLIPYKSSWWVPWGCTDIDVDDLDSARNLQLAFTIKGIKHNSPANTSLPFFYLKRRRQRLFDIVNIHHPMLPKLK